MDGGGFKHEVMDVYDVCKDEMDAFKNKTNEEIEQEVGQYQKDADVQKHIAKTDFINLIASLVKKIHDNNDLPELEKKALKMKILEKREKFGTDVMNWATEVMEQTNEIKNDLDDDMCSVISDFEDDVESNDDAIIPWLDDYYEEKKLEVEDQASNEKRLGEAQGDEVKTWLGNHVEDLQAALQEICE